jgi:predicted dehydrogenase
MASLAHGKHVLCSNPLATSAVEARRMRDSARAARRVNAVALEYRFNPLARQARALVARGDLGEVRFIQGHHLQDSLVCDTDFTWRLEPDKGGPSNSMAEIGSHWIDAIRFITGLGVERVLASLHTTVPLRRAGSGDASYVVTSEDTGSVMLKLEGDVHAVFTASQVCAGRENDLRIEISGSQASLCWGRDPRDRLWVGRRDRSRALISESQGPYDSLASLIESVYSFIAEGGDPVEDHERIDFPTFDDGYRTSCVIDAAIRSNVSRNRWIKVEY